MDPSVGTHSSIVIQEGGGDGVLIIVVSEEMVDKSVRLVIFEFCRVDCWSSNDRLTFRSLSLSTLNYLSNLAMSEPKLLAEPANFSGLHTRRLMMGYDYEHRNEK